MFRNTFHSSFLRPRAAWLFAVVATTLLLFAPADAHACESSEDCAENEVCITKLELPGELPHPTTWQDVTKKFPRETCVARDDLQQYSCRISLGCAWFGRCTAVDGECQAVHEEDCRASQECTVHASCAVRDGECVVGSDADCAATTRCTERGLCTAGEEKCVAGKDADCFQSAVCENLGNCKAQDGACVPG